MGPVCLDAAVHVHCRKERGNNAENAVEKSGENIGSSQPSMNSQFFLVSYPILVGSFCIISASFQRYINKYIYIYINI